MSYVNGMRRNDGGGDVSRKKYNDRSNEKSYGTSDDKPTKIVLLNCPADMQVDAVRKWCSQYGMLDNIRFTTTALGKIFFVDFTSFADAEKALRRINDSNPFNIKCEFSRKKEGNSNKYDRDAINRSGSHAGESNHLNNSRESRNDNISYSPVVRHDNNEENQRRSSGGNSRPSHQNRPKATAHIPVSFVPKLSDDKTLMPNGQTNFLTKFNNMSTQPQSPLNSSKYSNGTSSNDIKINDKTKTTVVTENFRDPVPHSSSVADSPVPSKRGSCLNCNKESKFLCERCKSFYCSHECQSEDWPFHKAVCNELPRLIPVKINYSKNFKILDPLPKPTEIKVSSNEPVVNVPDFNKNIPPPASVPKDKFTAPKFEVKAPKYEIKPAKSETKGAASTVPDDHPNKEEIDKIENFYTNQTDMDRLLANTTSGIEYTLNQFSQNIPKRLAPTEQPKEQSSAKPPLLIFGEFPKSRTPVAITAVISSDIVYIRSISGNESAAYCKLLQDVSENAIAAENLTELPKVGDLVLGDYQGTYNRAIVIKALNKQDIHIAYLDFGNTDIKRLGQLKTLNPELQRIPRYTFRVTLKDVIKCAMPEDGLLYLNELCDSIADLEIRYEIIDVAGKEKKCMLFDKSKNIMVNKRLNELMEIKPPTDDDKVIMIEEIKVRNMPPGKNVKVVVRDNSLLRVGCISVATTDCEADIHVLNTEINRYCNSQKDDRSYTPRINEVCLVFVEEENLWVRAICVETMGNGYPKMQLIDIGSFVDVNIKNIRRIPAKLTKLPCCAIQSYIKNLPYPMNEGQIARIEEFFPKNKIVVVDEVELDDGNPEEGEQSNVITIHKLAEIIK